MKTEFDNTALRRRIIAQFGTIQAFSYVVGMSPSCISNRLSNRTEFTLGEVQTWAKAMKLSREEVEELFLRSSSVA